MALNEACCLNLELAGRFCRLYFEICENDSDKIRNCALQGLIDQLVEHGAELFYGCLEKESESDNQTESQSDQQTADQSKTDQDQSKVDQTGESDQPSQSKTDRKTGQSTKTNQSVRTPTLMFRRVSCSDSDDRCDSSKKDEPLVEKSQFITLSTASASQATSIGQVASSPAISSDQAASSSPTISSGPTVSNQMVSPSQAAREQLIKDFVRFLLNHTRTEDERVKTSSVMGICKLMLLGRIYSPKLLSELILLWFNASTSRVIQQDIGTFLPIYCLDQSVLATHLTIRLPTHLTGQASLLECFMVTVENVYRLERGQQLNSSFLNAERSNYYDSNIDVLNIIDFMLNLLEPINHAAIATAFCERILAVLRIEREDEYMLQETFVTKYLIRSLHLFGLAEASETERQRLGKLVATIQAEDRYGELKKASITGIEKFMQKFS